VRLWSFGTRLTNGCNDPVIRWIREKKPRFKRGFFCSACRGFALVQAFQSLKSINVAVKPGNNTLLVTLEALQVCLMTSNRLFG